MPASLTFWHLPCVVARPQVCLAMLRSVADGSEAADGSSALTRMSSLYGHKGRTGAGATANATAATAGCCSCTLHIISCTAVMYQSRVAE